LTAQQIARPGIKPTADVANQITNPSSSTDLGGVIGASLLPGLAQYHSLNLARVRDEVRRIIHTERGDQTNGKSRVFPTLYLPLKCKTPEFIFTFFFRICYRTKILINIHILMKFP